MDTSTINELNALIDTALEIEAREGHLAHYLEDRAQQRGRKLAEAERREALELFEGYVRSVPSLLAAAVDSAEGTPVEEVMGRVLRAAVTYWDEADDLVPDELGLLGLLDDAYFTLQTLQRVSARLEAESGQRLVADDLTALDAVVREMLGEIAEVLDELVTLSLSDAEIDAFVAKVAEYRGSFVVKSAQTSFTGLSVDALVEDRLGFTWRESLGDELVAALQARAPLLVAAAAKGELAGLRDTLAGVRDALQQVVRADPSEAHDDATHATVAALLAGALVQPALAGAPPDQAFLRRCVDAVLEGAG